VEKVKLPHTHTPTHKLTILGYSAAGTDQPEDVLNVQ